MGKEFGQKQCLAGLKTRLGSKTIALWWHQIQSPVIIPASTQHPGVGAEVCLGIDNNIESLQAFWEKD